MALSNCYLTDEKSINGNYWKLDKTSIDQVKKIKFNYNLSEEVAKVLAIRKTDLNQITYVTNPSLKKYLPDPFVLKNMNLAINTLVIKIMNNEVVGLLGDYDVDGATSSAILYKYLKFININTEVYIPDRIKDGYGISKNAIDYFHKLKVSFLIALDCGTNDSSSILYAKDCGIDVSIIDHHEVKKLGKPISIVNPKLDDDESNLDILCTAGLAFLFIVGVNRELRNRGFFKNTKEPNLKKFLDIVAIGTICDLVPLEKTNRLFVKKGLEIINYNLNKGLNVLKNKLKLNGLIKAADIAYYIGPCINAAGRIGDPNLGFQLLTKDKDEDLDLIADKLINSNKERKTLEALTYDKAVSLINNNNNNNFIFLASKTWHPGIVGIIASRLVEDYKVPAFVMSILEEEVSGSIRSVKDIDISKVLSSLLELGFIESGGGHAMAGGFKLKAKNLEKLKKYLDKNNSIFLKNKKNVINIDLETNIEDLNVKMIERLQELEPYGMGNPEPKILIKGVSSVFSRKIGKDNRHLLCTLEDIYGKKIKAIAFNCLNKEICNVLENSLRFDVVGKITINEWDDKKKPQFLIEDLKII